MAIVNRTARWTPDEFRQKPRDYDPGLADQIVDRVANGQTLVEVCMDRDMPLPGTFLQWVREDPSLAERYQQAMKDGTDVNFDEIVVEAYGSNAFAAQLRVNALKHRVERAMPAKYGPRSTLVQPKDKDDDTPAGIDYAAEVRRKLQAMADRLAEPIESPAVGGDAGPTGDASPQA